MAYAHLPKPSLRSPAVAGGKCPSAASVANVSKPRIFTHGGIRTFSALTVDLEKGRLAVQLFVLLSNLIWLSSAFGENLGTEESPLASFKNFVNKPPIIKSLSYRHFSPPLGGAATNYYFARIQNEDFLFCQMVGPWTGTVGVVPKPRGACGRFGDVYWSYRSDLGLSVYASASDGLLSHSTNSVYQDCKSALRKLAEVLHLGLNCDGDVIAWEGSSVRFTNSINTIWTGELKVNHSGIPSEFLLNAFVPTEGKSYPHKLVYAYEVGSRKAMLPTTIDHFEMLDGKSWLHADRYEIKSVEVADTFLAAEMFGFDAIQRTDQTIYLHTNNAVFLLSSNNLVPVNFRRGATSTERMNRKYYVISFFVLSLGCLAYWARKGGIEK